MYMMKISLIIFVNGFLEKLLFLEILLKYVKFDGMFNFL